MNYDVFSELEAGALSMAGNETEQQFMERVLAAAFSVRQDAQADRIFERLHPRLRSCSAEERMLCAAFTAEDWMLNPQDTLHGGILSTAADLTMSVLTRYLKRTRGAATVQLSVTFLRPIRRGETFTVRALADHAGRRSVMIRAEIAAEGSDKLAATASGVFF